MSVAAAVASKKKGRRGSVITNVEFTPTLPSEKVRKKDVNVDILLNGYTMFDTVYGVGIYLSIIP